MPWLRRSMIKVGEVISSKLGLPAINKSGGTIAAGTLVYISSYDSAGYPVMSKADADVASALATWVTSEAVLNGNVSVLLKRYVLQGQNTNAGNVGDPVYTDKTTAGGYVLADPGAAGADSQVVGRIKTKSATVGEVEFDLFAHSMHWKLSNLRLVAGLLSADATGRALMAADYFGAGVAASGAHFANAFWTNTLVAKFADGLFAADAASRAKFADGIWTNLKLAVGVLSADATGRALMANNFFDAATALAKIAANAFDATFCASAFASASIPQAKLVRIDSTVPADLASVAAGALTAAMIGVPVVVPLTIPDAATGDVDFTGMPFKMRVIEAWAVKTTGAGNAGNSWQVKNGAAAITEPMVDPVTDQKVVRCTDLNDANHEIAAAGTLRVTRTKVGGDASCLLYVMLVRVA